MNSAADQCQYLLSSAEPVLVGLEDGHLALEPRPGLKTAGWLLGHLAITGDFGRRLCGRRPLCPVDWRGRFSPGSQPSILRTDYPPMTDLCDAFRAVYSDFSTAAREADPSTLTTPTAYEPARAAFPTAAEFVHYLLTGHLAYHLGQLVSWRAAASLK